MFPFAPNGNQAQQNIDGQRHCVLVAASNPHPLPTPVYRPQIQNLEQNENIDSQAESRLSDAETVAKSFPQVFLHCFLWYLLVLSNFTLFLLNKPHYLVIAVLCFPVCYLSKTASKT